MIMSTISYITAPRGAFAGGPLAMAAVGRWWRAYIARRAKTAAIAHLKLLSERDLDDIGLARSRIDAAVWGRMDTFGRNPAVARVF
jgi:uncharacterized protein YjiS (DUF1127 family)